MNSRFYAGRALLFGAAIFFLASCGARAIDPAAPALATWVGFSGGSGKADPFQPASFDVLTRQVAGGFKGTLTLEAGNKSFRIPCSGSVSKADIVNIEGESGAILVTCLGKVEALADGSVRLAAMKCEMRVPLFRFDTFLVLLMDDGAPNGSDPQVPAVQGVWNGKWTGLAWAHPNPRLQLQGQTGSDFGGLLEINTGAGISTPLFAGNIQGMISVPPVPHGTTHSEPLKAGGTHTAMLSADSSRSVVAVMTGLLLPPPVRTRGVGPGSQLQGHYMFYHSLADIYAGAWNHSNMSIDSGNYSLLPAAP